MHTYMELTSSGELPQITSATPTARNGGLISAIYIYTHIHIYIYIYIYAYIYTSYMYMYT